MESFNQYIDEVDADFWREFCIRDGILRSFDKGEFFVEAGSVGRYVGYVKSGTLKYIVYDGTGEEHVINLEFAGEFVADFVNSLHNKESKVSIVVDSPSEIYCLPTRQLREKMRIDHDFAYKVAVTSEKLFSQVYNMLIDSFCLSPKERYVALITKHHDLFDKFQLKDIASFLRITPTHLSRLRKELQSGK